MKTPEITPLSLLREKTAPLSCKSRANQLWWCNSHQRKANYKQGSKFICDPGFGGITLPCFPVDLTGQVELVEE